MKDHTLMQTIARANRVTSWKINGIEKTNGEIIDYYNVFRNMKKALKDYAQGQEGQGKPPVQEKKILFKLLEDSIAQGKEFCREKDIDLDFLLKSKDVFKNVTYFGNMQTCCWRKTSGAKALPFMKTPSRHSTKHANSEILAVRSFARSPCSSICAGYRHHH
jgi:type I restriction enzyme R subunit